MGVVWRIWLLITALLWLPACGSASAVPLSRWTLEVEDGTDPPASIEIDLPQHLDAHLPRADARYALRTEVPRDELSSETTLVIPHFEGIAELYVDGQLATEVQHEAVEVYRHAGPHVWQLPPQPAGDEPVELELRIDHRWTQSAWMGTVPRLHPSDRLGAHALAIVVLNDFGAVASMAALLLIGSMSLWVFLADRSRRSYLWFSVQLLSAAYYPFYVSGYSQIGLGVHDTLLVAISLSLALFSAIRFSHLEFAEVLGTPRSWPWAIGAGLTILLSLVSVDPHWLTAIGGRAVVAFLGAVVVYQVVLGIRLMRRPRRPRGAGVFLTEWLVLAFTAAFDGVAWLGLGEPLGGARAACFGLGMFAVLNAMQLAREHIDVLDQTNLLNNQLARRVEAMQTKQQEVEALNQRLREQMSHRSKQLFSMLSQLGTRNEATPQLRLEQGDLVAGRYRVMYELGAGGMGVVYAVLRQADEMLLALKVTMQSDAWGLARLAREAEIATKVDHPNVVAMIDVDIDPQRGFLFVVMEHVDGPSLAEHKEGFGRDTNWALDVLTQVAKGLAALHEIGVVHRDLKPANVLLLMREGGGLQVKITDFGISRSLEAAGPNGAPTEELRPDDSQVYMPVIHSGSIDPAMRRLLDAQLRGRASEAVLAQHDRTNPRKPDLRRTEGDELDESTRPLRKEEVRELELWEPSSPLTQAGCIVGTPVFMAPELALDPPLISPAADIFSFGVLAYQLLTGERPFAEPPVITVAEGRKLPPELDLDLERVPFGMREVIRSCLRLDPEARPNAAHLAEVLGELVVIHQNLDGYASRQFPLISLAELEFDRARDPDAPRRRHHETSPPEPHAA